MSKTIQNKEQYDIALARAYQLMQIGADKSLSEVNELTSLSIAIKNYEDLNYPMPTI